MKTEEKRVSNNEKIIINNDNEMDAAMWLPYITADNNIKGASRTRSCGSYLDPSI